MSFHSKAIRIAALSASTTALITATAVPGQAARTAAVFLQETGGHDLNFAAVGEELVPLDHPRLLVFDVPDRREHVTAYSVSLDGSYDPDSAVGDAAWAAADGAGPGFPANAQKVHWIVRNSFPRVGTAALAQRVGAAHAFDEAEAVAATQAAIWHLTDGVDLNPLNPLGRDAGSETARDVLALYRHLTGSAEGIAEPATPRVAVEPVGATLPIGGEVTMHARFEAVRKTVVEVEDRPATVQVTVDGDPIAALSVEAYPLDPVNGVATFGLVDSGTAEPGTFSVVAEGEHDIVGRLLLEEDGTSDEALIVATSPHFALRARAEVTIRAAQPPVTRTTEPTTSTPPVPGPTEIGDPEHSPSPEADELADTGASVVGTAVGGGLLALAGVITLWAVRRARRAG